MAHVVLDGYGYVLEVRYMEHAEWSVYVLRYMLDLRHNFIHVIRAIHAMCLMYDVRFTCVEYGTYHTHMMYVMCYMRRKWYECHE